VNRTNRRMGWRGALLLALTALALGGCDTLSYQYDQAQQRIADSLGTAGGEPPAITRHSSPATNPSVEAQLGESSAGAATPRQKVAPGQVVQVLPQAQVITATGYAPISAQPGATQGQRVLNAMRASKLRAYQELAAMVHGQYLFGTTQVRDMVLASDQFDSAVGGIVRGARVVKSYPLQDDIYATILELDLRDVQRAYIDMQ